MTLRAALDGGLLDPAQVAEVEWEPRALWRVHSRVFAPDGFNGTDKGSARFSPIEHAGAVIPTLYAATTVAAALMETVLHDAPSPSAGFDLTLDATTEQRRVAQLHFDAPFLLADLSTVGLRRLGLLRSDVIDSDKIHYPDTRRLAAWIYAQRSNVQGLLWTSRQDDSAQAVVLFGDRLAKGALRVVSHDQLFTDGPHLDVLIDLLKRLGSGLRLRP